MIKKALPILMILLMMSPLLMTVGNIERNSINSTQNNQPKSDSQVAGIDLERVTIQGEAIPNGNLEEWYNPHSPTEFYSTTTRESEAGLDSTVVFEGSHSMKLEVRAMDAYHYAEARLINQSNFYLDNPVNLTLDMEWYLDSIGYSINQDYVRMQIQINYKTLFYYIGSETSYQNSTFSAYFMIDGPLQVWNHLHRNITDDYYQAFDQVPTQYQSIVWYARSYEPTYTRIYLDDLNLLNGTDPIYGGSVSNGNFEAIGFWQTGFHTDPGDVAQCSDSHQDQWSMNLTALTINDNSYAYVSYQPRKLLTTDNQADLSFWWKLDDFVNTDASTYARVVISLSNATHNFGIYYYLFVGGSGQLPMLTSGNDLKFAVANFNTTGGWFQFNRNIWQDFDNYHQSENIWIDQVSFQVINNADDAKLSLLVDDVSFRPSILNDRDYEHQDAIGDTIEGWEQPPGYDEFTVTDFAANGDKAANFTLVDDSIYMSQRLNDLPINPTTELILDFNVYIDKFNTSAVNYILFNIYFEDDSLAYIIANSTNAFEQEIGGEGDSYFIILQEPITTGEWLNFHRDIVHDYEQLHGSLPNTTIYDVEIVADSGINSELTVFFDDLYIYYDPAPEISSIEYTPSNPVEGSSVTISAMVVDATTDSVEVSFRVNDGSWNDVAMNHISGTHYELEIMNLLANSTVEFSITAVDAFGKTTTALNGTDYFTFSVGQATTTTTTTITQNGAGWIAAMVGIMVVAIAIGVVVILYLFVYKKR